MSEEDGYVTLPEVKKILDEESERRELSAEQKYALEHAQRFSRLDPKGARKLINELREEINGLAEPLAIKLADLMPAQAEEVRAMFAKERTNVQKKDVEKILGIVERYR